MIPSNCFLINEAINRVNKKILVHIVYACIYTVMLVPLNDFSSGRFSVEPVIKNKKVCYHPILVKRIP